MELSERLSLISRYLPEETVFADIGSDHAYLPVSFCLEHPKTRAIAGEVNQGPFNSAQKVIEQYGMEERVTVRLGDGLEVLQKDEVSEVVIAGMGGPLIASILENGKEKLSGVHRLLLQPNVHSVVVRGWLEENGFFLVEEEIIEENGHIYEVLIADRYAEETLYSDENKETELWLGPLLMKRKNSSFIKKWERQLDNNRRIQRQLEQSSTPQMRKKQEIEKEIDILKEVLYSENS
ncbi:tRNA (adenine(22)-N(1))-methyltransferase [Salimicrobium flavidum]|uniref:tRNA (Adenine22-N1)-methyltransferase n=1 Tax=Salimicrobium flavidum TaxID=570947 RepID=A0A1N7IIL9_9BACI|nr:tRNA (adenine(22)-N(1))-methyltransferase TrmK [Salimicrobium flavidum]SIS36846.1 tRNA (adenine22-N1)-methyltransferase [Salimicrobium flavidum]